MQLKGAVLIQNKIHSVTHIYSLKTYEKCTSDHQILNLALW